jgi:hypothetical protein
MDAHIGSSLWQLPTSPTLNVLGILRKRKKDWSCYSVVEHMLSLCEALGSIPALIPLDKEDINSA